MASLDRSMGSEHTVELTLIVAIGLRREVDDVLREGVEVLAVD